MNPWLGLCANSNRGGIHSTWKHLPQVPRSPPCQGIHWNCHQDKHSTLQITIIARQQLALLQLVGREWLISISPRGEGRKGTFPFSWAKNLAPGAVWWIYCVRQISRGRGADVSPWQQDLFAHWIPVALLLGHSLFLTAPGHWSLGLKVQNVGKTHLKIPWARGTWGAKQGKQGKKGVGLWSSPKSEVFSGDR